jgi:hypothetical protein
MDLMDLMDFMDFMDFMARRQSRSKPSNPEKAPNPRSAGALQETMKNRGGAILLGILVVGSVQE